MNFNDYQACTLCPRNCRVNRQSGQIGFCGETANLRIAVIEAHRGEEPPISGQNGSGTVFFSGCSLKCVYCQNYQISTGGLGNTMTVDWVVEKLLALAQTPGIHNVNFVTPDHFFPHCVAIVKGLRAHPLFLPAVYNVSGYQKPEVLRQLEAFAEIYLVDYKYSDHELARKLSHCADYPEVALDAISEMVRQKGFLNSFQGEEVQQLATRGVLVRHLILPGQVQNSIDALTTLFLEFGAHVPLSLMSQYTPIQSLKSKMIPQRSITRDEFNQVYDLVQNLGFENLFVQFPEEKDDQFLPDFTEERPFKGNVFDFGF